MSSLLWDHFMIIESDEPTINNNMSGKLLASELPSLIIILSFYTWKFELIYKDQERRGPVSEKAQFEYAWCLVRSRYQEDMKKGVALLEDLFKRTTDDESRRDYLFYMAIGYTRIKEYQPALKYLKALLKIEPGNHQGLELHKYIEKKMKNDGLVGMAIVGGAAVALGGLIGLGVALAKK